MINRTTRDVAADAIREFMDGRITNREYERRYPRSKADPALREIYIQLWFLYSDISEHTMTGKHSLSEESRRAIERCILFLRSDFEYRWSPSKLRLANAVIRILGLGRIVNLRETKEAGETEVWPFFSQAEYQEVRRDSANQ
jgi:hypothetical protein